MHAISNIKPTLMFYFSTNNPNIATSVIYHEPTGSVEFLLHYFVSRELNIAYTISRHFEWSQNIVFFEDLPGSSELNGNIHSDSDGDYYNTNNQLDDVGYTMGKSISSTECVQNTIILSSTDGIVPSAAIDRYLKAKYKEGHRYIHNSHFFYLVRS